MQPTAFTSPSKEELRAKYGITSEDFEVIITNSVPDAKQLAKEESFLEKVLDFFGVPTFLKKLKSTGLILAVVFMPYWARKVSSEVKAAIVTSYAFYSEVLDKLPRGEATALALLLPDNCAIPSAGLGFAMLPTGTGIAPISAAGFPTSAYQV